MKVFISDKLSELTGVGPEILIDVNGNVLAYFFDGNIEQASQGNSESTIVPAA